jgi:hypothetical protein
MFISIDRWTRSRPQDSQLRRAIGEVAVHAFDLDRLSDERFFIEVADDVEPLRVVGDRDVLVAERIRGCRHLVERRAAVAPRRVHLQVTAQRYRRTRQHLACVREGEEVRTLRWWCR